MDEVSNIIWQVKRPRYAHMAKYHELRGEYFEADYNYNMLLEAQKRTLGESHPDLASVVYEIAKLNLFHEFEHGPEQQVLYNTFGRGGVAHMYYNYAMQVRQAALGEEHPAYAQSLYGLGSFYKLMSKNDEAAPLLEQALKIQAMESDPLPTALTLLCLADMTGEGGNLAGAIRLYQEAVRLLGLPFASLASLEKAEVVCNKAKAMSGDNESARKLVEDARSLQGSLACPYFAMTFELLESSDPELILMMLELHRVQYTGEFLAARMEALKNLAHAYTKSGNPAAAIPLLREVAEMQENEL